jgi:hypothetical protein
MPIERVNVLQHKEFGQKVVEWAEDPSKRPSSLEEMKQECAGILDIPDRITKLKYVDVELDTLLIRVPTRQMVEESVARFSTLEGGYPAPGFYRDIGSAQQPPNLDMLFMRIADYTIAQCA